MLKGLAGANFENLFVLAGLAFIALALLGDISGKISPGKFGRIASGILGVVLLVAGIVMHIGPRFTVKDLDIAIEKKVYVARCPVEVGLSRIIEATGEGNVIYSFEYSDGNGTHESSTHFDRADSKLVTANWSVTKSMTGWAKLKTIKPVKKQTKESDPVSVTCEGEASPTKPSPFTTEGSSTDSVQLVSVSPEPGAPLKRGGPVPFEMLVDYNLASVDSAILSVSVAELPASGAQCQGTGGELSDAVEKPIVRGKHQVKVLLTWSGDMGAATKGRVYGKGFLTFVPMFWANVDGHRAARINFFGKTTSYCYEFG
jgi:hypothetical protein